MSKSDIIELEKVQKRAVKIIKDLKHLPPREETRGSLLGLGGRKTTHEARTEIYKNYTQYWGGESEQKEVFLL